jgi:hypothetical protein
MSGQKNVYVFLNEHHELYDEQKQVLHRWFGDCLILHPIPFEGHTLQEMDKIIERMLQKNATVIFASPVPYLIQQLSRLEGEGKPVKVYVMHTDQRMQFKTKAGKQASIAAETGWMLT